MRTRGLQEIKIRFTADELDAEELIDALMQKYGKFEVETMNKEYELMKIEPIIIERFNGDEIDSPYTCHDSEIRVSDVESFIRRWDDRYVIEDLEVEEEIGEEE